MNIFGLSLILCLILSILTTPKSTAQEAVTNLPPLTTFERVRFYSLTKVDLGDARSRNDRGVYGQGRLVLPDQGVEWIVVPGNPDLTTGLVRIGDQTYANTDGEWRVEDANAYRSEAFLTGFNLVQQLEQLAACAGTITRLGEMDIAEVTTTHYQFQVPQLTVFEVRGQPIPEVDSVGRVSAENTVYKYDVWIDDEGRVHQQNIVEIQKATTATLPNGEQVSIDEREYHTLVTYYDFDDPDITVEAPMN
ncbi:MAG: hypothetical protein AAGF95_22035 [Chloroflexota bacterium]